MVNGERKDKETNAVSTPNMKINSEISTAKNKDDNLEWNHEERRKEDDVKLYD
jgi:hypothetical protein